jgi:multiple sugar transport system permease protein
MFNYFLKRKAKSKQIDISFVNKRVSFWKPLLTILPALTVLTIFIIIPFYMATRNGLGYYPNPHKKDHISYGLKTFKYLLNDSLFHDAIFNTIVYALISVPILISLSAVISALIASVIRKKVRGFLQTIFFIPYVTSAIAIALAFAYLFDQDKGIINAIIGKRIPWLTDTKGHHVLVPMLVAGIWKGMAFNILIFTTSMLGVDKNLYKSASIDGAGPIKQFFSITLPSIKKATGFLVFMAIIGSTKIFPLALFSNNAYDAMTYKGSTLMLYIFYQIQTPNGVFLAGAASVSLVIISISLTIVLRKGFKFIAFIFKFIHKKRIDSKTRGYYV